MQLSFSKGKTEMIETNSGGAGRHAQERIHLDLARTSVHQWVCRSKDKRNFAIDGS